MGTHAKATLSPTDQLHSRDIRKVVLKIMVRTHHHTSLDVLLLIVAIEYFFHPLPETLLPLKYCLLCDHARHHAGLQTATEEVVGHRHYIVQGIRVHYQGRFAVIQLTHVDDFATAILAVEDGLRLPFSHHTKGGPILTTDSVAIKKDRFAVPQLHAWNMYRVAGDRNSTPHA